ncbi:MAG: hypothetical protein FJ090_04850 [Deltaproteobacteria bacterium]|nr:hypothetical protein [Deltaproteobacteria bacterium]
MPGPVFRGNAADPVAVWKDGKLLDKDGVGTLLAKRGAEWCVGEASTPTWRQNGNLFHKAAASEPFCRLVRGEVLKGNGYEALYRVQGEKLLRGKGAEVFLRGPGLTAEELLLAALALEGG